MMLPMLCHYHHQGATKCQMMKDSAWLWYYPACVVTGGSLFKYHFTYHIQYNECNVWAIQIYIWDA